MTFKREEAMGAMKSLTDTIIMELVSSSIARAHRVSRRLI